MKAISIFLITVVLIAGMVGCGDSNGNGDSEHEVLLLEQTYEGHCNVPHAAIDASGAFVIVYQQDDGGGYLHYNIYAQKYSANGIKTGAPVRVNTNYEFNDNYAMDVAMNEDGVFAVVWQNGQADWGGNQTVVLRVVGSDGNLIGDEIDEPFGEVGIENVEVAIDGNNITVGWYGYGPSVFNIARYFVNSNNVSKYGDTITVVNATEIAWNSGIGLDIRNNRIITAFIKDDSPAGIYVKGYNFTSGDVYLSTTEIDGNAGQREDIEVRINDNGDILAAWVPFTGNDSELYVRAISNDGTLDGDKYKINQGSDGYIGDVNLMLSNSGDFDIVWYNNGQNDGINGIFRRTSSSGELGEIDRLDTRGIPVQFPTADMNTNGDYIIAWHTYFPTDSGSGIYGLFGP